MGGCIVTSADTDAVNSGVARYKGPQNAGPSYEGEFLEDAVRAEWDDELTCEFHLFLTTGHAFFYLWHAVHYSIFGMRTAVENSRCGK